MFLAAELVCNLTGYLPRVNCTLRPTAILRQAHHQYLGGLHHSPCEGRRPSAKGKPADGLLFNYCKVKLEVSFVHQLNLRVSPVGTSYVGGLVITLWNWLHSTS